MTNCLIVMKLRIIVWAAAAFGLVSIGIGQSESFEPERTREPSVPIQRGSTQAPDRFTKSENAQAMQEVARLTIEASLAFDRGDDEVAKARARSAADKLKSIEQRLTRDGSTANARARSKLAEQRGRLHLEFLGDEDVALEAFEDALVADENPLAERLLIELIERKERRTGSQAPGSGN